MWIRRKGLAGGGGGADWNGEREREGDREADRGTSIAPSFLGRDASSASIASMLFWRSTSWLPMRCCMVRTLLATLASWTWAATSMLFQRRIVSSRVLTA